jgi:hypothetical protein
MRICSGLRRKLLSNIHKNRSLTLFYKGTIGQI